MKKVLLSLSIFLFMLPLSLVAQHIVKGTVKDEKNEPLMGVTVQVEGTQTGTVTDFDGNFQLELKKTPATLIFDFLGYQPVKVKVTDQKVLNVTMKEAKEKLQEVIIGYGTSPKNQISGTVSEVKTKQVVARQFNNVATLLQGRTTGIQINANTGTPGGAVSVRIRGANSLRGNNEPLYVVDGVIINSAAEDVPDASTDANEMQAPQNGLTGIDPQDIKSIVILKDASATAIYGSRGANGVVLITTKKGKKGAPRVNVYSNVSFSSATKLIPVLDGVTYAKYRNDVADIDGNPPSYFIDNDKVYLIDSNTGQATGDPLRQVNWQKEIYDNAVSLNNGFNVSGGLKKSTYYISFTRKNINGIIPNTFLNTNNFRLNYASDFTKKIKFISRLNVYTGNGTMAQGGSRSGGSRSFTRQLISYNPLVNGELSEDNPELGVGNPFQWLEGYEDKSNEKRLNFAIQTTYKIKPWLHYKLNAGINYREKRRSRWYDNTVGKGSFTNGYLALSGFDKTAYTIDNLLTYRKRIGSDHHINAVAGITFDGSTKNVSAYEAGDFPIDNLRDIKPELGQLVFTPYTTVIGIQDNVFSYLTRITYTFKDKYIFNASFRADKSSKFKGKNKTGYFPAFSFAWNASKESFLEDSETISKLKVRASWGQVGNQAIKPYQTFGNFGSVYYSDAGNATVLGVAPLNIANDNLTWETTTQANVGADVGILQNRIQATLDIYNKKTSNLLIFKPLPLSSGYGNMITNQGSLVNRGFEFSVNALPVDKKDFSVNIGVNISFNRNKITDLSAIPPSEIWINGELKKVSYYLGNKVSTGNNFKSPANAFIEGQPVGLFWGYKTDGIYETQDDANAGPHFPGESNLAGDVKFVDIDGDGLITDADKTNIGDPNPDFTYGFNATVTYKNFSLNMLFNGVYGNDVMNGNLMVEDYAAGTWQNIRPEAYNDAWRPDHINASHPRIKYGMTSELPTDRLVEDGSYLRLKNVTLNYNLKFKKNPIAKSANIYISGNNLLTITNYSGYDPEITSFLYDGTIIGVDWLSTPNIRTYSLGVNIKF